MNSDNKYFLTESYHGIVDIKEQIARYDEWLCQFGPNLNAHENFMNANRSLIVVLEKIEAELSKVLLKEYFEREKENVS